MRNKVLLDWWASGIETPAQFISRITNAVATAQSDPVLSGVSISEAAYEALTYYENRTYTLDNGAVYNRATLVTPPTDVYGGSDIHVATTGNDSTGNGTQGNPYLTLGRAWDAAPLSGGITIWMHGGTFAENVSASGMFNKAGKSFVSPVKIKGIQGVTTTITSTTGTRVILISGTVSNVIFQNLTLQCIAATLFCVEFSGTHSNMEFRDCRLLDDAGGSTNAFRPTGTGSNFKLKRSTVTCGGAGTFVIAINSSNQVIIGNTITSRSGAISLTASSTGTTNVNNNVINNTGGDAILAGAIDSAGAIVNIKRNSVTSTTDGITVNGGTATNSLQVHVDYNTINCAGEALLARDYINGGTIIGNNVTTSGLYGIAAPDDGHSTTTFSTRNLDISYNTVVCTGVSGHTFILSTSSDHNTVSFNVIDGRNGGSYGIVGKGSSHTVHDNLVYGGANSTMLLKACDNYSVTKNLFYQIGTGYCLRFNDTPVIPFSNVATDNFVIATQAGSEIFNIPAAEMGTGNIVDRNKYYLGVSSVWGLVLVGPNPTTIAEVRAKWAANYPSAPTNDANSTVLTSI